MSATPSASGVARVMVPMRRSRAVKSIVRAAGDAPKLVARLEDRLRHLLVQARTDAGPVPSIAFAIDESLPTYAGRLPIDEVARRIARASGPMGHCADYLFETVAHLEACGIRDRSLAQILSRVRQAGGSGD